jgi:hypothetical protein
LAGAVVAAVLWHPVSAGAGAVSRRLTPQTQHVLEGWLRQHAQGRTVLLENGWLDLEESGVRAVRVPNLTKTLDAPLVDLARYDFVVVPETHFTHPRLRDLYLVHRVRADQHIFGGNTGYDFEVYAVPKLR